MIEIRGRDANELFTNVAKNMIWHGRRSKPRGLETIELEDAWLTLEDSQDSIVTLPERGIDMDYLMGELEWYRSGSLDVNDIGKHSKFWYGLANADGTVNSNYGAIALHDRNRHNMTQFEWCEDKLREDPETRQAVIVYNQPKHKDPDTKDFVCTLNQLFRINNGRLDSTVMMRSNDLIYGLTYDMPWFTHVQEKLAQNLCLVPGKYQHYAASLHVYEKHFPMLQNIANASTKLQEGKHNGKVKGRGG